MGSNSDEIVNFTHKFSPYAQRVTLALREKGIPFKSVFVDVHKSKKPQELLDANPIWGKVPTITHRGIPVAESLVILEYLEEAFPEKLALMPKDAVGKAKVRFWADYITKGIFEIWIKAQAKLRAKSEGPEKVEYLNVVSKYLRTLDDAMTDFSKDGPFFTGEDFGYLDVVLAPISSYVLFWEKVGETAIFGPDKFPRLDKWIGAMSTHKSVSDTITSNEEALEFSWAILQPTH